MKTLQGAAHAAPWVLFKIRIAPDEICRGGHWPPAETHRKKRAANDRPYIPF